MGDQVQAIIYVGSKQVTFVVDPGDGEMMSRKYDIVEWVPEYVNSVAEHINSVISKLMANGVMPLTRVRTLEPNMDSNADMLISLMGMTRATTSSTKQAN